jgi:hypothetical protein
MLSFGLLNEAIGRGCASLRSLLTVHGMVCRALVRWGTREQQTHWLPRLADGRNIAAFALTEPERGSDVADLQTRARAVDEDFVLDGRKRWITFGARADLFLVFAATETGPLALLVERERPGLEITPLNDMLGTRAAMLAELHFRDCRVPRANLVGRPGFGIAAVALSALELGRYSVAWGCVGILHACRDAAYRYAAQRRQFGSPLRDHQLIRRMLTNMAVDLKAARMLAQNAGRMLDQRDPAATREVLAAKYFASRAALRAAEDAVQIHGAVGCGPESPVSRHWRDAKIMEIIEGSTQMQQLMIADSEYESIEDA